MFSIAVKLQPQEEPLIKTIPAAPAAEPLTKTIPATEPLLAEQPKQEQQQIQQIQPAQPAEIIADAILPQA